MRRGGGNKIRRLARQGAGVGETRRLHARRRPKFKGAVALDVGADSFIVPKTSGGQPPSSYPDGHRDNSGQLPAATARPRTFVTQRF
jgi:hypothetical protein